MEKVVGLGIITVSSFESHSSRGAGWLYRCQELTQSPIEQHASCGDVQSSTAFEHRSAMAMSVM